jgi:hypothetical protein
MELSEEPGGYCKLTVEQIRAIRRAHADGCSLKVLAFRYKTSIDRIQNIVIRKFWPHIK